MTNVINWCLLENYMFFVVVYKKRQVRGLRNAEYQ